MKHSETQKALAGLPAVDKTLAAPELSELSQVTPRPVLVGAIRREIEHWRERLRGGAVDRFDQKAFFAGIAERVELAGRPNLRRVINATGIVIHTNLGRSPLAPGAIEAVVQAASGYSNLEFDLDTGKRGSRYELVEDLLCEMTCAEAALAVNNNAGAVLLVLSTLCRGREVVVSRGELVEIGGSFRIPEVMEQSGAILREVGATNRTHERDYLKAIGEDTAALLKVHASNYRVVGFTKSLAGAELARLAHENDLLAIEDLGSGSLVGGLSPELPDEPTAGRAIAAGMDIVTFSGDKLLGGPQAGIIIGKAELIERIAKNPLHRALRLDKMTLAALEATLRLYREPEKLCDTLPTAAMIRKSKDTLKRVAQGWRRELIKRGVDASRLAVIEAAGQVGGGALPLSEIPGYVLAVDPQSENPQALAAGLRALPTPIIGRIAADRLLLDPRTVMDADRAELLSGLTKMLA